MQKQCATSNPSRILEQELSQCLLGILLEPIVKLFAMLDQTRKAGNEPFRKKCYDEAFQEIGLIFSEALNRLASNNDFANAAKPFLLIIV